MNIQIFGKSKCFDTKKAERFFKERKINLQYVDIYKYDCLYIVDMGLKDFLCNLDIPYFKIAFLCI